MLNDKIKKFSELRDFYVSGRVRDPEYKNNNDTFQLPPLSTDRVWNVSWHDQKFNENKNNKTESKFTNFVIF